MANTLEFTLTENTWTDISTTTGASGFITNRSTSTIFFTQSETPPLITTSVYHRLNPVDRVNYSVTGSEVIYARSKQASGVLSATGGVLA